MKKSLKELEIKHGGIHRGISKSGKEHQGGDRCCTNGYDAVYELFFPMIKNPKVIVEIGTFTGTGLRVLSDYFPNARIIGLDISPETVEDPGRAEVHFFDQRDPKELDKILNGDKIDIVIDDGLHRMFSMVNTYDYFREYLNDNSLYFIEDLHPQGRVNNPIEELINNCTVYQPKHGKGRIAVITNPFNAGITEAGKKFVEKYKNQGELK
tara:strand:+ start:1169 stop:1798 length:630 start_codon:yes stop_codon:yes gene_type:complete